MDEPTLKEPALQTVIPETSATKPPPEPAYEPPTLAADPPAEQSLDGSENPEVSSPVKTNDPPEAEVEITETSYTEPGRPTVLAKCTAKEALLERRKVRFDLTDYSHMSAGENLSGYLSQVHSSRDVETDMVKQMHHKFEV